MLKTETPGALKVDLLLIVSDGELEMTGNNTLLLVIASSIASEFENLGSQVLKYGGEVYWSIESALM